MEKYKAQIRETALNLFLEKGIESVSGYDIAVKSKVRYSVLEEYYSEKIDLVIEIYKRAEANMFKHVYGELIEIEEFKDLMRKLFHQSVIWSLNSPKEHAFMDYVQSQPYIWSKEHNIYPSLNPLILAKVKEGVETGVIKDFPIDFLVHFMMKMLNACVSYIVALKTLTTDEYEYLVEPMFESCWDALKK